jgi:Na+-translocating ferredoxin:NAD+ oxidoreductase RnfC subunit
MPEQLQQHHTPLHKCSACLHLCCFQVIAENQALIDYKKKISAIKQEQESAFLEAQKRALEVSQQHRHSAASASLIQINTTQMKDGIVTIQTYSTYHTYPTYPTYPTCPT